MANYDVNNLRDCTYRYADDPKARIPCPDCHDNFQLDLVEYQPFVAAMLNYCPLCDGERYISKARALAVLPTIAQYVKELKCQKA